MPLAESLASRAISNLLQGLANFPSLPNLQPPLAHAYGLQLPLAHAYGHRCSSFTAKRTSRMLLSPINVPLCRVTQDALLHPHQGVFWREAQIDAVEIEVARC